MAEFTRGLVPEETDAESVHVAKATAKAEGRDVVIQEKPFCRVRLNVKQTTTGTRSGNWRDMEITVHNTKHDMMPEAEIKKAEEQVMESLKRLVSKMDDYNIV